MDSTSPIQNFEHPKPESELDRLASRKMQLHEDFFQLMPNVLVNHVAKKRILPIDMVVYMILKDYQGLNDRCWASNQSVARLCGRDISTVKRSIQRLIQAGHIQRQETEKGKTAFTFFKTTVIDSKVKCGIPPIIPPLPELNQTTPRSEVQAQEEAPIDFSDEFLNSGQDSTLQVALERLQRLKLEPPPTVRSVQVEGIDSAEEAF